MIRCVYAHVFICSGVYRSGGYMLMYSYDQVLIWSCIYVLMCIYVFMCIYGQVII